MKGNTVISASGEFAVDPACMGLHMLSVSLLFGILLAGLLQRKLQKRLPAAAAVGFLLFLFALNLAANLCRMIILIQFAILPGAALHDLTGIVCLLLYVCIPAGFDHFIESFINGKGKPVSS